MRAKFLAVTAAALAVGLTACSPGGSGEQSTVNNALPPTVQEDSGTSAVDSPVGEAQGTTGEGSTTSAALQQNGRTGDPLCKAADLKLSFGESDGAAGSTYQPLIFTNSSDRSCVLQGFPGVSYVGGEDGHQIGEAAFREGKKGEEINLEPGGKASAMIKYTTVENYDSGECRMEPAKGLRIYPPQETASMFIPFEHERNGCAGNGIPGHQLTVQTIQAGVTQ
ncbi:DUF4232 domain-containing protein [Saccharopolyspora hirsuta]|uniref:DUF4232 domain-containing protein n=2 Tax=Saccharopolyspora hirsuta TaxID=1837 RepID=A0A5M7BVE4_SACHI|nr:DUF4232 domain-containing protein [Saccharopolyspora hirsuta]